jgi:hypothetical protein
MTINYQYIHIFIILLIFNFTLINNTPRPPDEVAEPDEGTSIYADLTSEWEQKMQDFKFEYIYYIPINPREQEIYFENVTTVPTTFKGGYFLSDESTNKIEFYIKDSENRIIYEAKAHHNLFEFNVTKADRYSIIFRNNIAKEKVVVTFTMNTGQNDIIGKKELTETEKKLDALDNVIKKFNMEFKLSRDIHTKRYKSK